DKKLIREFVERHFPAANYIVLKGLAETKIAGHLQQQRNPLVVLGAYRRSRFSRMFHPSMADHLMRHLQQPLFIAHNKS
ncbi:MAG TPA: universal stress protein, partial [Flavisolibacter sp.]|nr:universal stress protein [Flavisolibacter sp.]